MNILDFKKIFVEHAPCESGREAFLKCNTRLSAFDLAATPQAADFLMKAAYEGWGPDTEDLKRTFRPYINGGRTVCIDDGERRTGVQIWCDADEIEIEDDVRCVLLFGCRGSFIVKDWQTVKVMVDPNSRIKMQCSDSSLVYVESYGGTVTDPSGICRIRYKLPKK